MKIAAIIGSNRQDSYNLKLAQYLQKRYADQLEFDIVTLNQVPFYNQDIENEPPAGAAALAERVKRADAVLWVTPEYNATIPGVLKNAIDWLSRGERVMVGKPSWIMGASMGLLGTVKAQAHLRDILFAPGLSSPLLPGNEVYVGAVHEKINAEGDLIHEPTAAFLDQVVNNFITWYHNHQKGFSNS
ncbi:NAD(P)H-dependent oxidoreductase [Paenibacillus sp. J5C_2022]|uniref:NADPH-dependent FMN reductase n=1 Tax=Paenibacillus sp. J5C2022 TaxID=2977129 RepID=UPI0021CFFB4B|nr:NADPH-dependent FMN reductase [Paenibacillus sp. J5C2022]MCU6707782.1 NAD(P)H-dependent oxidoreductase [Paenibacillus sp. J5C2022]